jgi:hypothetical protein
VVGQNQPTGLAQQLKWPGQPMPAARGARTLDAVTVSATGRVARREVAAQWPTGNKVDGTSSWESRGGCRARGGGGRAYRAVAWREVVVEEAHRRKSGGGQGPLVLGASQSESGEEG